MRSAASAFFTAAFFTPQNANNISVVSSSEFDWDSATKSIGGGIKSDIGDNSGAHSSIRDFFSSVVDQLESSLIGDSDPRSRSEKVSEAQAAISSILDEWNSKEEIGKALKTEPDQHLKDQGQDLIDGDVQGLRQDFQDLLDDLFTLPTDQMVDYGEELADQIDDALAKAKAAGVSEDDDLYKTYEELAKRLRHLDEYTQDPNDSGGQ